MPSTPRLRRKDDHSAVIVRPASLADVDIIVRFRMELLRDHGGNPIYRRLRSDAETRARRSTALHLASGREITYVALLGRDPVGMLRCLECRGSPLLNPARYAYITSVFVVKAQRKSGIATRLMDAAVTWARARGLPELRLHVTPENGAGMAAWDRLGFGVVEQLRRKEIVLDPGA